MEVCTRGPLPGIAGAAKCSDGVNRFFWMAVSDLVVVNGRTYIVRSTVVEVQVLVVMLVVVVASDTIVVAVTVVAVVAVCLYVMACYYGYCNMRCHPSPSFILKFCSRSDYVTSSI